MPKVFPKEFREDVVRVARNREPGVTIAQVAKDFGIHQGTLEKWLYRERVDSGETPGITTGEHKELRELRKRNRLLEQEVEVFAACGRVFVAGASAGKMMYPLVSELAGDGIPVTVSCRVLQLSRQPYYRWLRQPVGERELTWAYRANAL